MSARKIANELWEYANKLEFYSQDLPDYWPNPAEIAVYLRDVAKRLDNEETSPQ